MESRLERINRDEYINRVRYAYLYGTPKQIREVYNRKEVFKIPELKR